MDGFLISFENVSQILGVGMAFFFSLGLCPFLGWVAVKYGWLDHPDQERKKHSNPVPFTGGLSIWFAVTFAVLLSRQPISWGLWLGVGMMGGVGLLDDFSRLHPAMKLILQIASAMVMATTCVEVSAPVLVGTHHLLAGRISWMIVGYVMVGVLYVLWVVTLTNAMNFTDNAHGLCGGMTWIILVGILILNQPFTGLEGREWLGIGAPLLGAIAGFLIWNFPKGKIFLGDCGSHLLGACLATMSAQFCLHRMETDADFKPIWTVLMILAVPLVDLIQVNISRLAKGKPIWQADTNHLAHRLMKEGLTSIQSVMVLWGLTFAMILLAIWVN